MKLGKILLCLLLASCASNVLAERTELDDGTYVDESGNLYDNKFENDDFSAPWNDPFGKDDPFAPWNDALLEDDVFAPWNSPLDGQQETNKYLRENGERDSSYYWK